MIILTIVVQVLLRSSKWGTALYATGSNLKAAKMARYKHYKELKLSVL